VTSVSHGARPVDDADVDLIGEYQRLASHISERRERATQLRALADHAEAQAERDERALQDIGAMIGFSAQLCMEDIDPRLRGPRLEEIALELLRGMPRDEDGIHYREWFGLLRSAGHHVGGKDPLATFLAQINRSRAVERIGQRTGRYRLRVVA